MIVLRFQVACAGWLSDRAITMARQLNFHDMARDLATFAAAASAVGARRIARAERTLARQNTAGVNQFTARA
jgi:hypothetical protein